MRRRPLQTRGGPGAAASSPAAARVRGAVQVSRCPAGATRRTGVNTPWPRRRTGETWCPMCNPSAGPVPDKANARRTTVDGLSVAWANTMGSSIADAAFDTFCRQEHGGGQGVTRAEPRQTRESVPTRPCPTCSTMETMLGSHCAMTIPKSNLCWSRHIRTTNDERSLTVGASTTVLAATSSSCFLISYAVPPAPPVCNMRKRDDIVLRNTVKMSRSYVFPLISRMPCDPAQLHRFCSDAVLLAFIPRGLGANSCDSRCS